MSKISRELKHAGDEQQAFDGRAAVTHSSTVSAQATRVLYISYDGMLEPLGQSQVLAYLTKLAKTYPIHLLSFEKRADWQDATRRRSLQQALSGSGISWHPMRYHKSPSALATAWDIACGTGFALWLAWRYSVDIVHARSYVASVMALPVKSILNTRFIFDMRGFWADERVDGGLWPAGGAMYRVAKWFERRFLLSADEVVSLTQAGVDEMRKFPYLRDRQPPFTVIPTCADLDRFAPAAMPRDGGFVLGYVGSAGTWYLFDEAAACFRQLLRIQPAARLLIVNRGEHDFIRARLAAAGIPAASVELTSSQHADVPRHMARMNAGLFFIKPAFSKQASAPTKLAEFLGCGIPCLSNTGVGDMARVLEGERVGVAVNRFDAASLESALHRLLRLAEEPGTSARCVDAARRHFSLEEGVARYHRLYTQQARTQT